MERREAPGRCATAPFTPLAIGACTRLADGFARPIPRRARPAVTGLRDPPPGRCASRRSTPQASVRCLRRQQRAALSAARTVRALRIASTAIREPARMPLNVSAVLPTGITFFGVVPAS
jgi:hypothetical protein